MKIGVNILQVRPERLTAAAQAAERLGYESLWVSDHLAFGSSTESRYPYSPSGESPVGPSTPFLEPLATLSFVAAATERIRLGTAIYVLPLRSPVATAKLASTVDVLSNGRLLFGLGVGWMAEEFIIAGEDFSNRVKRSRECVEVMKALWTQDVASFDGAFYHLADAWMTPKPVQQPHPPLIFGGETDAALRRAAILGDGWIGMKHSSETARPLIDKLNRFREEAGRGSEPFEITVLGGPAPEVEAVKSLEEIGVHRVNVYPFGRGGTPEEDLDRFAQEVIARL